MKKYNKNFIIKLISFIILFLSIFLVHHGSKLSCDNSVNSSSNKIHYGKLGESKLLVHGGSPNLIGFVGRQGEDSKNWYAFYNGINVSDACSKTLQASSTSIHFNESEGLVYWDDNLDKGTYSIKLTYEYDAKSSNEKITTSINITLDIIDVFFVSGGSTKLNGTQGFGGYDSKLWQAKYLNKNVTLESSYSLINAPHEVTIDNNGQIAWNDNLKAGSYIFSVYVEYSIDDVTYEWTSPNINLIINHNFLLSHGSTYLTSMQKKSGIDENNWMAVFDGENVTKNVIFDFIDAPQGVTINQDGYISWDDSIPIGKHTFNLTANYVASNISYQAISEYITLEITPNFFVTGGSLTLYASTNQKSQDYKKWNAIYCNQLLTTNVEWFVFSTRDKFKIFDGCVQWDDDLDEGTWTIVVEAKLYLNNKVITAQSPLIKVYVNKKQDNMFSIYLIAAISGGIIIIATAIIVPICVVRFKKKKH